MYYKLVEEMGTLLVGICGSDLEGRQCHVGLICGMLPKKIFEEGTSLLQDPIVYRSQAKKNFSCKYFAKFNKFAYFALIVIPIDDDR